MPEQFDYELAKSLRHMRGIFSEPGTTEMKLNEAALNYLVIFLDKAIDMAEQQDAELRQSRQIMMNALLHHSNGGMMQ